MYVWCVCTSVVSSVGLKLVSLRINKDPNIDEVYVHTRTSASYKSVCAPCKRTGCKTDLKSSEVTTKTLEWGLEM